MFTVDARARALRYTPPAHVSVPCLSPGIIHPRPAASHPALIVAPTARSFLLPRALLRHPRASSRSRNHDVSAAADSRVYHRFANTANIEIHPLPLGHSTITLRIQRGGAARFRGAPGENVRYAQRNAEPSKRTGQRRLARSRRYRVSLSLAVVSASTFPPATFRRVLSAALGRARPRPPTLGRTRRLGAGRARTNNDLTPAAITNRGNR